MQVWVAHSCPTADCSPPGSSVYGILQARILEWVAIPFSRRSSWHKDGTRVSCITGWLSTIWATKEVHMISRYKRAKGKHPIANMLWLFSIVRHCWRGKLTKFHGRILTKMALTSAQLDEDLVGFLPINFPPFLRTFILRNVELQILSLSLWDVTLLLASWQFSIGQEYLSEGPGGHSFEKESQRKEGLLCPSLMGKNPHFIKQQWLNIKWLNHIDHPPLHPPPPVVFQKLASVFKNSPAFCFWGVEFNFSPLLQ